jgi:hypothetical protein
MYRRPENLDKRIDDALFEKLMDIAAEESDAAYGFGSPQLHFERAVLSAAKRTLDAVDAKASKKRANEVINSRVKSGPSKNPRNRMSK